MIWCSLTEDHRITKKIKNFEEKALLPPVKSSPQNLAFPLSETKKKKRGEHYVYRFPPEEMGRTLCIGVSPRRKGENTMYTRLTIS